mgnify:CR=1 FL=1
MDGGKNDYDILILCLIALKGKRLTTFCASLALLHPLLSLTHWIFRSLMLPYKSSSHSAKCVRCASLRSGGRRLAVRKMIEYQIGALPRTPFPATREFPSRGNERYEEKNRGVICFMYYSSISPFGGWRHHLSPASGGTITRASCRAIYEENVSRRFILPPEQGEVRRSRKGGGERSEPVSRMPIMPYDTESKSRNADFISIALRAIRNPRGRRPRQT